MAPVEIEPCAVGEVVAAGGPFPSGMIGSAAAAAGVAEVRCAFVRLAVKIQEVVDPVDAAELRAVTVAAAGALAVAAAVAVVGVVPA